MLSWMLHHTAGWQVLVLVAVVFAVVAAWLDVRGRRSWVPSAFLLVWAAGSIAGCVNQRVDHLRVVRPPVWVAACVTLLIIVLMPLTAVQVSAWIASNTAAARRKWWIGGIVGVLVIPLANLLSGAIGNVVLSKFPP